MLPAILIPTKDRVNHLLRQLLFYKRLQWEGHIYILDSTIGGIETEFSLKFQRLARGMNIHYYNIPEYNDRQAIQFLLEQCDQKYSAFIGDDDFFVPSGLISASNYLESNPTFRVVRGRSLVVGVNEFLSGAKVKVVSEYGNKTQRSEMEVLQRLSLYAKNYFVPMFSVHRTAEYLDDWRGNADNPSRSFGELLPNFLTLSRGLAAYIDVPYLIRLNHSSRGELDQSLFHLICRDQYSAGAAYSIPILKKSLVDCGIEEIIAENKSYEAFNHYFESMLSQRYKASIRSGVINLMRSTARKYLFTYRIFSIFSRAMGIYKIKKFFYHSAAGRKSVNILLSCIEEPLEDL